MKTPTQLIKEASTKLRALDTENSDLRDENSELQEKIASFERASLAREIVLIKVASGASIFEDVQEFEEEVTKLAESERDLAQLKTAMQYAGPQYVQHSLVEQDSTDKVASTVVTDEPEHLRNARLQLEAMLDKD
jgi:cell division septum initiation protein DivIVA